MFEKSEKASPYGGRDWLTNALAELDRAWGAPLPDLRPARKRANTQEDAAADVAMPSGEPSADQRAHAEDSVSQQNAYDQAEDDPFADIRLDDGDMSPWASWTDELDARGTAQGQPESEHEGAHRRGGEHSSDGGGRTADRRAAAASRDVGASDSGAAPPSRPDRSARAEVADPAAPDHGAVPAVAREMVFSQDIADGDPLGVGDSAPAQVIGCVVVVDLICGGEPVTAGATLLRGVMERLADQIPAGARLRLDDVESALSVVLPGQDRTVASDWMHRTLPAVFRDSANLGDPLLPVGTALHATVHDTEGPVGAQLLQRLDRVRHGDTPPVPVRWGVPIAPGSGGRRRRPEGEGASPIGAVGPGSHSVEKAVGNERRGSTLFDSNPEGAGDPSSTASGVGGTVAATGSRPGATGGTASNSAARGGNVTGLGLSGRGAHNAARGGEVASGTLSYGSAVAFNAAAPPPVDGTGVVRDTTGGAAAGLGIAGGGFGGPEIGSDAVGGPPAHGTAVVGHAAGGTAAGGIGGVGTALSDAAAGATTPGALAMGGNGAGSTAAVGHAIGGPALGGTALSGG